MATCTFTFEVLMLPTLYVLPVYVFGLDSSFLRCVVCVPKFILLAAGVLESLGLLATSDKSHPATNFFFFLLMQGTKSFLIYLITRLTSPCLASVQQYGFIAQTNLLVTSIRCTNPDDDHVPYAHLQHAASTDRNYAVSWGPLSRWSPVLTHFTQKLYAPHHYIHYPTLLLGSSRTTNTRTPHLYHTLIHISYPPLYISSSPLFQLWIFRDSIHVQFRRTLFICISPCTYYNCYLE